MSETLTDFLLARIAEDEGRARTPLGDASYWQQVNPGRVLAECEAKRRIVEHLRTTVEDDLEYSGHVWFAEQPLRYLALPYADHPDYRDEWRP